MRIRLGNQSDINTILEIALQALLETEVVAFGLEKVMNFYKKEFEEEKLKAELMDNTVKYYLAESDEGQIIGYAKSLESNESESELSKIYLLKSFQRMGYGKIIYSHIEDDLTQSGKKNIKLEVWKGNQQAINFYKSLGYNIINEERIVFKMRKEL